MSDRLTGIQLLRGVAALMIVLYHSGNALTGLANRSGILALPFIYDRGFYAVDLFFAISGFIICLVYDRSSGFSRLLFFFRRFWRIYPIYFVFCALAVIWYRMGLPQLGDDPGWDNIVASVLILPQPSFPIYAVGWTLEHEVIFYLFAGLLLPWIGKWGLFAVLIILGGLGWLQVGRGGWDFHLLAASQLQFAAGVLAYLTYRRIAHVLPFFAWVILGIVLYVLPEIRLYELHNFRVFVALGSCCLIYGMIGVDWASLPRLDSFAKGWGDLTFAAYLLHWAILPSFGVVAVLLPAWLAEPYRLLAIAAVFIGSFAFHRWVERPMLSLSPRIERTLVRRSQQVASSIPGPSPHFRDGRDRRL